MDMSKMTKAELLALVQTLASKGGHQAKQPGFTDLTPQIGVEERAYVSAKAERVLADGSVIVWTITPKGWIGSTWNLRFNSRKQPIPGIGGSAKRWKAYRDYMAGTDFLADMAWAAANGGKADL